MEEARQHTSLNGLYWLSLVLLGLSLIALVGAFVFKVPIAAQAFAFLAFFGLLVRGAAYIGASLIMRASKRARAILLAAYGLIWLAFAASFFVFVVLRQFEVIS